MLSFFKKAKEFIVSPRKAFEKESGPLSGALAYLLVMALFSSLLGAVLGSVFGFSLQEFLAVLGETYFLDLVGTLAMGVWLHAWSYLLGARGAEKTLKVVIYGSTPSLAFGWLRGIPEWGIFLRFAFIIWGLVLYGIGLKKVHRLSSARSASAVIIASVIGIMIIVGIALFTFTRFLPLLYSIKP